jgi:two-component system sensor histidine kinase CpxA
VLSLPPRPTVLLHPHGSAGWIRRAPFFLLAFAVCYLLAQYLSRPVTQLRRLTNRFAEGDLSIRITDRGLLKRQDELGGLARDFNQMAARIETLVAAQQRLLADVSHELRSPLTRLALALGLLKRKSEDEGHPSIQRMEREVRQLNTLIQRLLTLSRLESIDEPLEAEPIALCTLLEEVVTDADFEAAQNEKRVELARRDGCTVRGERELLRSAVENVVRNAIRYTPRGTRVTVEVMREDTRHEAVIRVRDQGPGVPAEEIPRLFEPFYRVATARERDSGGAGLGLAITHRIVGLHGGRVSAANRERGGLELSIALPLVHAAPQLEAPLVAALGCGEVHVAQNK